MCIRARAEKFAHHLMDKHGLTDWEFRFDRSPSRFGLCDSENKIISLSRRLVDLNDWVDIEDTVIHEVAHAIVEDWRHHDRVWRKKCLELGGTGQAEHLGKIVAPQYVFTCPNCNWRILRYRRDKVFCRNCRDRLGKKFYFSIIRIPEK